MSDLTTILVIIPIAFGHLFVYYSVDRLLSERLRTVLTGVLDGIPISKQQRRMSLWFYSHYVGGAVGGNLGVGLFYLFAAKNAVAADVKTVLYICAVVTFGGVAAWIATGVIWHRHVAAILRQDEAD